MNIRQAVIFLGKYILPYRRHFVAFYVGWLVETIITLTLPALLGIMLDQIIYQRDLTDFFHVSGVVVILSVYACVLYYWLYAQHHYLMIMFTFGIKKDAFEQFLYTRAELLEQISQGEMISLILEYPAECMHFLIRGVIHQINNFIIIGAILFLSFRIHPVLGIMMFVLALGCGTVTVSSGRKSGEASRRHKEIYGQYLGWLYEVLDKLTDIRFLHIEGQIGRKWKNSMRRLFGERNKMEWTGMLSSRMIQGIFLAAELLIFLLAFRLSGEGALTVGMFTVVMTYFNKLTSTVADINIKWNDAQTRAGYIEKLQQFLSLERETETGKLETGTGSGEIRFEHLCFFYGSRNIYYDFCESIHGGEKLGIVGESGSGKSTLAELLLRFLDPDSGRICLDGENIRDFRRKSLRQYVGIVFQRNMIFSGSIRENLKLAKQNAAEEEMKAALEAVQLGDFLAGLKNGLDTELGTHGIGLSTGQKQRLAIAQVWLRNPSVVIFDEATAALDRETEAALLKQIIKVFRNRTCLFITHREGPMEICDRILWLEGKDGTENFL